MKTRTLLLAAVLAVPFFAQAQTARMEQRAETPPPGMRRARRLLQQMGRELMLAQASDWPFIMRTGTSPEYALGRIRTHLGRFWTLDQMLERGEVDPDTLEAIEYADRIFPDLDPRWYGPEGRGAQTTGPRPQASDSKP